jgi:hypothetical protein
MKQKPSAARVGPPGAPLIPIREVRGQRVLLDTDLAAIYGVATSALNQAVKRNAHRFPEISFSSLRQKKPPHFARNRRRALRKILSSRELRRTHHKM